MTNGTQGAGVTFKNVGGAGTMADLIVTGYGDSYEAQGIYCQKLDGYGAKDGDLMYWYDVDYGLEGKWFGWYDIEGGTPYNETELAAGEGVWLTLDQNAYVQSSGEVIAETLPVAVKGKEGEITGLSQLCPNPTPVAVTMGKVNMSGYGDSYEAQGIYCNKIDSYGKTMGALMYWYDVDYGIEGKWFGWYDIEGGIPYSDVTLNPGETLWMTADGNYYINWPSPIAK